MKNKAKNIIVNLYLDYINNYLTLERFAKDNDLTHSEAFALRNLGERINERLVNERKEHIS